MPSNEKERPTLSEDDFEDISVVLNLLEVQARLKSRTDLIEHYSE